MLRRAKIDHYLSREDRARFLEALIRESELVDISETVKACRDPEDDRILELAVNGHADFLITGDADLLSRNTDQEVALGGGTRVWSTALPDQARKGGAPRSRNEMMADAMVVSGLMERRGAGLAGDAARHAALQRNGAGADQRRT